MESFFKKILNDFPFYTVPLAMQLDKTLQVTKSYLKKNIVGRKLIFLICIYCAGAKTTNKANK